MNKPALHRFLAIFFAIYLPVALIGVPLHKHYCQGELEEVQVFFEINSCHDKKAVMHGCCPSEGMDYHMKTNGAQETSEDCNAKECCDDQLELLRVDVNLISQGSDQLKTVIVPEFYLYISSHSILKTDQNQIHPLRINDPPGPYRDGYARIICHEQFLC